jgi:hypothetical protein
LRGCESISSLWLERGKHGFSVLVRFKAAEDACDFAFGVDHERGSFDAHILLAVHALFLEHVKFFDHGLVFVGQQGIRQVVLFFEFLLGGDLIGGDAEYNGSSLLDFLECVAEPARFYGSTGRVGLGIKKQDHILAAIVFQRDGLALFIRQGELGGFIINFHSFFGVYDVNEFIS